MAKNKKIKNDYLDNVFAELMQKIKSNKDIIIIDEAKEKSGMSTQAFQFDINGRRDERINNHLPHEQEIAGSTPALASMRKRCKICEKILTNDNRYHNGGRLCKRCNNEYYKERRVFINTPNGQKEVYVGEAKIAKELQKKVPDLTEKIMLKMLKEKEK